MGFKRALCSLNLLVSSAWPDLAPRLATVWNRPTSLLRALTPFETYEFSGHEVGESFVRLGANCTNIGKIEENLGQFLEKSRCR